MIENIYQRLNQLEQNHEIVELVHGQDQLDEIIKRVERLEEYHDIEKVNGQDQMDLIIKRINQLENLH